LKAISQETTELIAARNLALAEKEGADIAVLCSACTSVLTEVAKQLNEDPRLLEEINSQLKPLGLEYRGTVKMKHFTRILYEDVGLDRIRAAVKRELHGLSFAPHYGCHYLKPSEAYEGFDEVEAPQSIDRLIEATGAESVNYEDLKQCCGGALLAIDKDIAMSMADSKLKRVKAAGADAIVLVCPFCSVMYDDNQREIESIFETEYKIPVLYYPQVLGLALGIDAKELGLNMNRVKTKDLLNKLEAAPV
ncbi:MAG: CoB--CoM heterodisulfide reductase subunit B, partial [Candidatus Hydrogenedentota bacterium]